MEPSLDLVLFLSSHDGSGVTILIGEFGRGAVYSHSSTRPFRCELPGETNVSFGSVPPCPKISWATPVME